MAEVPNQVGHKRHHRPKENCGCEVMRMKENQTGSDVRPIRIANRDQLFLAVPISFRCGVDELCQLLGAGLEILDIKNSFGKASKEAWHPVFQNLATHTQKSSPRPQLSSERQQV